VPQRRMSAFDPQRTSVNIKHVTQGSVRVAYNVSQTWAVAVEEYADYEVIKHFLPADQQLQQLFGVIDYKGGPFNIEAGLGFGLTAGSDRLVAKIMLSRDLYTPPGKAN
jgi:hypothetical protein